MCSKKKDFFRFLKEKGVYAAYKRNFGLKYLKMWHNCLYKKIAVDGENFFNVVDWKLYINHAFHWASTKEGEGFWQNLSIEWVTLNEKIDTPAVNT
jgi:hypothetical protein